MKEINPLLEKLAGQLGTTVGYLWEVLIRQAPINSLINIFQYFILFIITWLGWKIFKKVYKIADNEGWDEVWLLIPIPIGVVICVVWMFCFLSLTSTINGFFNPEYWALKQILETIKK